MKKIYIVVVKCSDGSQYNYQAFKKKAEAKRIADHIKKINTEKVSDVLVEEQILY